MLLCHKMTTRFTESRYVEHVIPVTQVYSNHQKL